ncbi:PQQ-binding-like beta-propeller repeat protein [Kitasatospora griseola]|uniref:outer membrane protein assembly factor BamB family protein n=1 Tax=Kitasatospora griseola TaxID=2064 RepID=UPI003419089E
MATELWERVLHQRGAATKAAVTDESVLVHERTRLVCLDPADGTLKWEARVGHWPDALLVVGPRVLVLSPGGALHCLSRSTGAAHWRAELPPWTRHLAVANGVALAGGWRGYTAQRAFDLADGRLRWQFPVPVLTHRPVAWAGGFLLGNGTRAWLIDPLTGREQQSWQLPEPLPDTDFQDLFTAVDADRCAVRCGTSGVALLQRDSPRAELLLTHDAPLHYEPPLLAQGLLWLRGHRPDCAVAVDPADSTVVHRIGARHPLAHGILPPATVVTQAGTVLHPDGATTRLGIRTAAVHDLGGGRLLAVTRNSVRAYCL